MEESPSARYYLECLHVWMVLVRLRREGKKGKQMSQEVFDRFCEDTTKQVLPISHTSPPFPSALNLMLPPSAFALQSALHVGCPLSRIAAAPRTGGQAHLPQRASARAPKRLLRVLHRLRLLPRYQVLLNPSDSEDLTELFTNV